MSKAVAGISTFLVHSEQENAQNELTIKLPCLCEICIPTTCLIISILSSSNSFCPSQTSVGQCIILMEPFPVNITQLDYIFCSLTGAHIL